MKLMRVVLFLLFPAVVLATTDDGKYVRIITDADIVADNFWSSDTVYNLSGLCFVEDGEVLTIEPGTVIKGDLGQGDQATALVVARGGTIYAQGTVENPIIFTSISDDVDIPDDMPYCAASGQWGGLAVLGEAVICDSLEGHLDGIPVADSRGRYGGQDDQDVSGVLEYVSIRHAGATLHDAAPMSGLTLAGVGCGTVVRYVEVVQSGDDGFEWLGGSVSGDHLISVFNKADGFDFDLCWRGGGQFFFSMSCWYSGDQAAEHDGGYGSDVAACPVATPLFSNVTYIGRGSDADVLQRCLEFRDAAAGGYWNSIFTEHSSHGIRVEKRSSEDIDSHTRLKLGQLRLYNNIWRGFGSGEESITIVNGDKTVDSILFHDYDQSDYNPALPSLDVNNRNYLSNRPVLRNLNRIDADSLDPRFSCGECTGRNGDNAPWEGWANPLDPDPVVGYHPEIVSDPYCSYSTPCWPTFEVVDFPGAFDPAVPLEASWAADWPFLHTGGFLGSVGEPPCDCLPVNCCIERGDVNYDGGLPDISDLVFLIAYMFGGGPEPPCMLNSDINGDGEELPNISDLVYLIAYMFTGGPPPAECPE